MSDVNGTVRALPPRINALQSAWLREIGVPRNFAQRHVATRNGAPVQSHPGGTSSNAELAATRNRSGAGQIAADAASARLPDAGVPDTRMPDTGMPAHAPDEGHPPAVDITAGTAPLTSTAASTGTAPPTARPVAPARPSAAAKTAASKSSNAERNATHDLALLQSADFDGLRALVTDCEVCKLCHTRAHAVFGTGAQGAQWMIVGEAPGEQEDAQAEPFVGKSGQLLTQMLQAVGVDGARDVFITNIVKCRPPGNRNPKVEEIEACKPYLLRQIDLVAPRRLLVLGRFAAQVLLGSDASLASLRGRVHTFTDASQRKIPLVVSYHPAYLLRSPFEKARTWQDLHLAMSARRTDD